MRSRLQRSHTGSAVLQRGFTITELLVVIVIAGILGAIAMPMINAPQTGSEANALLTSLRYARSVAVKQGTNVIVCPSTNPNATTPTCASQTSWSTGWIVLVPAAGACTGTGGQTNDQVVQVQQAFTSKDSATSTGASGSVSPLVFCFTRTGLGPSSNSGYVEFKTSNQKQAFSRCVMDEGVGHLELVNSGASDSLGNSCP